ncbi:PorV/PorQ family protein [candidate division KSB1 bacterium]|nr:PorV/PorQ family protein [candidate division KSB1 bacterium]
MMMKRTIVICAVICSLVWSVSGQDKWAQTGFQFLSVNTNARATAMGNAFTTAEFTSEALFYNPAGLASVPGMVDISLSQMEWIADINHMAGTLAYKPFGGRFGVIGFSFQSVDYGEIYFTQVADNEQGFVDVTGGKEPSSLMLGLGYGRELSDRFSIGGQIKYASQNLGYSYVPVYSTADTVIEEREYDLGVVAFDFGTLYRTGYKSLKFGMSVRNFAREVKYEKEGFQLPLTFRIGVSMDATDLIPGLSKHHSFLISFDAVHPRSHPEFVAVGGEYVFMDMLILRAGYISNHEEYDLTAGFGIKRFGVEIDYSYVPFSIFDNINRFTAKFSF